VPVRHRQLAQHVRGKLPGGFMTKPQRPLVVVKLAALDDPTQIIPQIAIYAVPPCASSRRPHPSHAIKDQSAQQP
jgi:hypothetical protein